MLLQPLPKIQKRIEDNIIKSISIDFQVFQSQVSIIADLVILRVTRLAESITIKNKIEIEQRDRELCEKVPFN